MVRVEGGVSVLMTLLTVVQNLPATDYSCVLQVYDHMLKRYTRLEQRVLQKLHPGNFVE